MRLFLWSSESCCGDSPLVHVHWEHLLDFPQVDLDRLEVFSRVKRVSASLIIYIWYILVKSWLLWIMNVYLGAWWWFSVQSDGLILNLLPYWYSSLVITKPLRVSILRHTILTPNLIEQLLSVEKVTLESHLFIICLLPLKRYIFTVEM